MKRFFLIFFVCSVSVQARSEEILIRQVNKLADKAPSRADFVNYITFVPQGKKANLFERSKQVSPRLYATLLRAKTSLVFTDEALKQKLNNLVLEQDLLDALEAKNLAAAFEAIEKGADVNTTTESGHTALMLAVSKADQSGVQELLKRGAKQNTKGEFKLDNQQEVQHMSAFELAKQLKYEPIAQLLKKAL